MNLSRVYPVRFSSGVSNWGQGYPEVTESMRNYKIPSMTLRTEADMYRDLGKNLQNSRVRLTKPEIAQAIKYGWEPNDAPISFIDSTAPDDGLDDGDSDDGDGDKREGAPHGHSLDEEDADAAAATAAADDATARFRKRAHRGVSEFASPVQKAKYNHFIEKRDAVTARFGAEAREVLERAAYKAEEAYLLQKANDMVKGALQRWKRDTKESKVARLYLAAAPPGGVSAGGGAPPADWFGDAAAAPKEEEAAPKEEEAAPEEEEEAPLVLEGDRILARLAKPEIADTLFVNAVRRVDRELALEVPIPEGATRRPIATDEVLAERAIEAIRRVRANAEFERGKSRKTRKRSGSG